MNYSAHICLHVNYYIKQITHLKKKEKKLQAYLHFF